MTGEQRMNRPVEQESDMEQPTHTGAWGKHLAAIREKNGIPVSSVAAELRLEPKMVELIEAEDLDQLPTAPFVKGYLRHYARMMDVDVAPILEAYGRVCGADAPGLTKINRVYESTSKDAAPRSTTWMIVAVIVASLAVWWWTQLITFKSGSEEEAVVELSEVVPSNTGNAIPVDNGAAVSSEGGMELPLPQLQGSIEIPAAVSPTSEPVAVIKNGEVATLPAVSGMSMITLKFTEESWVDVTDATGARLLVDLAKPNSSQAVTGKPPFNVLLGNSAGVSIEYNGKPYDQRPHNSKGVSRFTLGTAD